MLPPTHLRYRSSPWSPATKDCLCRQSGQRTEKCIDRRIELRARFKVTMRLLDLLPSRKITSAFALLCLVPCRRRAWIVGQKKDQHCNSTLKTCQYLPDIGSYAKLFSFGQQRIQDVDLEVSCSDTGRHSQWNPFVHVSFQNLDLAAEDHGLHHRIGYRKSHNYGKQPRVWDWIFGACLSRIESAKDTIDYDQEATLALYW